MRIIIALAPHDILLKWAGRTMRLSIRGPWSNRPTILPMPTNDSRNEDLILSIPTSSAWGTTYIKAALYPIPVPIPVSATHIKRQFFHKDKSKSLASSCQRLVGWLELFVSFDGVFLYSFDISYPGWAFIRGVDRSINAPITTLHMMADITKHPPRHP